MRIWWMAAVLAIALAGCMYSGGGDYGAGYSYENGRTRDGDRDEGRDRRHHDGYHRDGDSGGYRPDGRRNDGYHRDGDAGGYRNGGRDGHHDGDRHDSDRHKDKDGDD